MPEFYFLCQQALIVVAQNFDLSTNFREVYQAFAWLAGQKCLEVKAMDDYTYRYITIGLMIISIIVAIVI